jgi:hypothetical protein
MKVFRIKWAVNQGTTVDLGYDYHLPFVQCLECSPEWKNWGSGMFEYPAFKFDFLNHEEFTDDRVVSVAEFHQIRRRIVLAAGRPVLIIPGASIGELSGTSATEKLNDFAWGRITVPQVSKRARDWLANEGINLLTAECSIRCRGKTLDSHLAIQVEPVPLMTEESLAKFRIHHCPRCGNYKGPLQPGPVVPGGYMLSRSAWPVGQHLVQMVETLDVIASEEFMEAVRRHHLTGIAFEECGRLI